MVIYLCHGPVVRLRPSDHEVTNRPHRSLYILTNRTALLFKMVAILLLSENREYDMRCVHSLAYLPYV